MSKKRICLIFTLLILMLSTTFTVSAATCKHEWGPWRITKQPTCTGYGSKRHTCKKCHETWYSTIIPQGHTWKREVIKNRTCTGKGLIKYTCTKCGKVKKETPAALGHHFGTYKKSGKSRKQLLKKTEYYWELCCSRCGKEATYGGVWSATKPKSR